MRSSAWCRVTAANSLGELWDDTPDSNRITPAEFDRRNNFFKSIKDAQDAARREAYKRHATKRKAEAEPSGD